MKGKISVTVVRAPLVATAGPRSTLGASIQATADCTCCAQLTIQDFVASSLFDAHQSKSSCEHS